jgi:single-strand DNA-binding protein
MGAGLRRWDGGAGRLFQLDVEDVGVSLKYARAKVMKLTRSTDVPPASADPWATSPNGAADTEPPF